MIAASKLELGFDEAGTPCEVLVKPGDKVTGQEQALARLQTNRSAGRYRRGACQIPAERNHRPTGPGQRGCSGSAQMDAAQALKATTKRPEQALEDIPGHQYTTDQKRSRPLPRQNRGLKIAERIFNSVQSTAGPSQH